MPEDTNTTSTTATAAETKTPAVTIDIQEGVYAKIGTVNLPIAMFTRAARTVKQKGGGVKEIKQRIQFRAVIPDVETAVRALHQALLAAGDAGKELAEKILGGWLADASEAGIVTDRAGRTSWSEDAYSKALVELHAKRAGNSIADLQKESTAILAALVNSFEQINKWTEKKDAMLADGSIELDANGNLSADPFTAEDWAAASVALERQVNDIDALLEYQLSLKARRLEVERQLAEKNAAQERAKATREANKAKKEATPAPAQPAAPAEEPVAH